jgi:hypothetical protein
MNGRNMLLVLAHLFRKRGNPVSLIEAVDFLSFKCRYGSPTDIRKMLAIAVNNEMISYRESNLSAEFLYDKQLLPTNLSYALKDKIRFKEEIEPLQ